MSDRPCASVRNPLWRRSCAPRRDCSDHGPSRQQRHWGRPSRPGCIPRSLGNSVAPTEAVVREPRPDWLDREQRGRWRVGQFPSHRRPIGFASGRYSVIHRPSFEHSRWSMRADLGNIARPLEPYADLGNCANLLHLLACSKPRVHLPRGSGTVLLRPCPMQTQDKCQVCDRGEQQEVASWFFQGADRFAVRPANEFLISPDPQPAFA